MQLTRIPSLRVFFPCLVLLFSFEMSGYFRMLSRQSSVFNQELVILGMVPPDSAEIHEVNIPFDLSRNLYNSEIASISNDSSSGWRSVRGERFDSWFDSENKLHPNADENGTILDFLIAGFPKCGTTSMEANLGYYAPMPISDICTPVHQTVYYAYKNWPRQLDPAASTTSSNSTTPKLWRGSKCPRLLETNADIQGVSKHLPRTKLIVGLRHPIHWYQSFWNMLASRNLQNAVSPYDTLQPCKGACAQGCPGRQIVCVPRAAFHIALARMGKTPLATEEREWLGGRWQPQAIVPNWNITNAIFLYDLDLLAHDELWDALAQFLGAADTIRHDRHMGHHAKREARLGNRAIAQRESAMMQICDPQWDSLRVALLEVADEMAHWLLEYLWPVARERPDEVVVPLRAQFTELVKKYREDPCGRLEGIHNATSGRMSYTLRSDVNGTIKPE